MIGLCGHENYGTHMSRHTSLLRKHRESQDLARRHIVQPRNLRFPSAGDVHRTAKAYTQIYQPKVLPKVTRVPHPSDLIE